MGIPIAVGVGFIVMGLLAMGAAAEVLIRGRREAAASVAAPGVVVDVRRMTGRAGWIYFPVVQFRAPSGKLMTVASRIGSQPPQHQVGQPITVHFPAERPQSAEIEAPVVLWMIPVGFAVVGLVFAGAGALMVLVFGLAAMSG
ncbi:DUF3592 domain-containing protein [Longimicrobium sp.]|uniref:DUF3592 domain-containing protein n=1 Tax=Longimicrobium sp. TaxID=2029185 RepID=UPI002C0391C2|nr:DUF3592 domain-containing protein [Longimicrobium sp.]HSU15485.1 DUF3592 domain-containing protein [Longimicrobium sp.]